MGAAESTEDLSHDDRHVAAKLDRALDRWRDATLARPWPRLGLPRKELR